MDRVWTQPRAGSCSRRTFLKGLGVGTLGGALGSTARCVGLSPMLRVGVIGAGAQGSVLAANAVAMEGVRLAAVCDPLAARRSRVARLGRRVREFADARALLDAPAIDAVMIATPNHLHAPLAVAAMRAGKDVYVEPPLGRTFAEAIQVLETARETGRVVQVGYQRRSQDMYAQAREIVESGTIGELVGARCYWHGPFDLAHEAEASVEPVECVAAWATFLGPAPAREPEPLRMARWADYWDYSGGWAELAMAPQLDAVLWLTQAEPVGGGVVRASGSGRMGLGEVPQAWVAHFGLESGCPAVSCFASASASRRGFGEQLMGTSGMIEIANMRELRIWGAGSRDSEECHIVPSEHPGSAAVRPHLAALLAAIRDGAPLACGPDAAAGVAALTQAALDSYRGGGRPIALAPLRA